MNTYDANELKGPATTNFMPTIILKGNSYERGVQYGRHFREYLEKFYYWFVKKEPKDVIVGDYKKALEIMETVTAEHMPLLLEEIKGWSDGAKLEYDKCRLMFFHNEIYNVIPPHCSNILVSQGAGKSWLGRNCDLYEDERSWQILLINHCDDCYSYAGGTYLGLPLSVGVNETGLVIGGSSIPSEHEFGENANASSGMPNLLSLFLQTQNSVEGCCETVKKLGHLGKSVNVPILDRSGKGVNLVLANGKFDVIAPDDDFIIATNHSLDGSVKPPKTQNPDEKACSIARNERLTEIFSSVDPHERTPELGKKALGDSQGTWPVCEHVENGFHTTYSSIIRPGTEKVEMDFCWGYPCRNSYEPVELEW